MRVVVVVVVVHDDRLLHVRPCNMPGAGRGEVSDIMSGCICK